MLGSVDFVAIPSRDPERSRAFYVETLGLRPDERAQYEFWCGDTCFAIWQPERIGWDWAPQKNGHIAFHVDDIEAERAALETKGVVFSGETFDTGVCRMAFFSDPDGNDCMLHSRYAPRA